MFGPMRLPFFTSIFAAFWISALGQAPSGPARADSAASTTPAPGTTAGKDPEAGKQSIVRKKAIIIPVEEQVDFGLHAFLKRAVAEALEQKPDYLVFKINTYGGELQSAFEIVDLLMGISQCSTYAYVEQKAISAGALIALANNRLAMGAGTTIGDCAPITQSQDGIVMLGEKIQSPLRATFRTMAEKNGYPSLVPEPMMTSVIGVGGAGTASPGKKAGTKVYFTSKQWEGLGEKEKARYRNHKTVVAEGQLLTMTDREAQEHGFSQGSFASLEEFLESKGWERAGEIATTWS